MGKAQNIECLYTGHFFKKMHEFMVEGGFDSAVDHSETQWFMQDVEEILIREFGARKTDGGAIVL